MVPIRRSLHVPSIDRRWRRGVQRVPYVRRRQHPQEPEELGRGDGPAGGAAPAGGREAGDCCCRSQEVYCARLSVGDPGH